MLRPLTTILCAFLIASCVTYLPAIACKKNNDKSVAATAACTQAGAEGADVTVCTTEEPEEFSAVDALKSTLRAGRTVGKVVLNKAVVVASSMARAARHAAAALVESAYSLV